MEALDYWRLCDELSVIQAALLIVGVDPATSQDWILEWEAHRRPDGFDAAFAALKHAIMAGRLQATVRRRAKEIGWTEDLEIEDKFSRDENGDLFAYKTTPDWSLTTIALEDLRAWLSGRGIRTSFFFTDETELEAYLNPANEHYSPKLAAAICAWEAVNLDPSSLRGKTVKQASAIWLRRNADRYGLTKEDGSPNEQGIEEVSKIANWDTKGGAPKTPGS
jgi:hypothetical protein